MFASDFYPAAGPGLQLRWRDSWIEIFPESEFAETCRERPGRAKMYRRTAKAYERCSGDYSLTVADKEAVLDYGGRFEKANTAPDRDFDIGKTKIIFTDSSRSSVGTVLWQQESSGDQKGKPTFEEVGIRCSWQRGFRRQFAGAFKIPRTKTKRRITLESTLRPGQLHFRRELLEVYDRKCCLSEFDVERALEAAHILPYQGVEYDDVRNGLLVRADLHRLFDAHLLSIHPKTLTIHLSPKLAQESSYVELAGKKLCLPKAKSCHPADVALLHHWNRFKNEPSNRVLHPTRPSGAPVAASSRLAP